MADKADDAVLFARIDDIVRAVPTLQLDTYMDFVTLTIARDDAVRDAVVRDREFAHVLRDRLETVIAERVVAYTLEHARKSTSNFHDYLECPKRRRRSSIFVHESDIPPGSTLCELVAREGV